ncbi:hypothetical protein WJX72_000507 [[Myrmecia] bisecta]|uniref:Uncharacterized protein n=1 Tax=[Myrmecia] bisecta TaxID=41462 RepID=A0AAW1PXM9_9CHLO
MQTTLARTVVFAPAASSRARAPLPSRRTLVVRAGNPLIGEVNDPEKTAKNKEKKAKEGLFAEPHNKNKLEKTTLAHGIGAEGGGTSPDVNKVAEKAKDAGNKAANKVKEAVNKVTGQ